MWSGYTAREAADLVGLSESMVRSCVRAGLLAPDVSRVPTRFSFRDLKVLKIVKSLGHDGVSPRRIRRQLGQLLRRMGPEISLSELTISSFGGHVVVHDSENGERRAWRADNGQMLLSWNGTQPAGEMASMPAVAELPAPAPIAPMSADGWFERALELEEDDSQGAIAAYKRALRLRPDCTETLINLGRLHAEGGEPVRAEECFREALELDPSDPTAVYNLGVVAQDTGQDGQAIELYRRALELDPGLSEAHYNLATIYDRTGDPRAAIRHINEYRKLTREPR